MNSTRNPKVPVLMYHEVLPSLLERNERFMTPLYVITTALFEDHMRALAAQGYRSLLPQEVTGIEEDGKYVTITFDDGLAGNSRYALPILKKYGFRATFFVAVGSVGSEHFMNWEDLRELVDNGMSVQSHTVSHAPLETLDTAAIRRELSESKQELERRLNTTVSALSFPHGSYDRRVMDIAGEAGYRYLFSSDMSRTYRNSFLQSPAVLGRLAMTYKINARQLLRWTEYDNAELLLAQWRKRAKNRLRKIIGIKNYSRLYRLFFNIK